MRREPGTEVIDDDVPEATDERFERARPAKDVLPGLVGEEAAKELLRPRRDRPSATNLKEHLHIRPDAGIVDAFRHTSSSWQTRYQ